MTNKQLAAARKAFSRFPGYQPVKSGETITPKRISDGTEGTGVVVHEATSEGEVERQLIAAIGAMS